MPCTNYVTWACMNWPICVPGTQECFSQLGQENGLTKYFDSDPDSYDIITKITAPFIHTEGFPGCWDAEAFSQEDKVTSDLGL